MDFVNKLPLEYKLKLIENIEQMLIRKMSKQNGERMQRFLESWKKSVNRSCGDYNTHSLLYPVAFNPVPETK